MLICIIWILFLSPFKAYTTVTQFCKCTAHIYGLRSALSLCTFPHVCICLLIIRLALQPWPAQRSTVFVFKSGMLEWDTGQGDRVTVTVPMTINMLCEITIELSVVTASSLHIVFTMFVIRYIILCIQFISGKSSVAVNLYGGLLCPSNYTRKQSTTT